jgi:hypothetical protein
VFAPGRSRISGAACLGAIFLALLGSSFPARAQSDAPARWTAHWITAKDAPERDAAVVHFRKSIALASRPEHFIVHVSADNRFHFYVNGERVGEGPARSDPSHWRYETFDLAPYLHAGNNVLAATVWNFGVRAPLAQMSDRTAFLVQGHGETERASDTGLDWEAEVERGHTLAPGAQDEVTRYYYVAGPGERIDGARYDWAWKTGAPGPGWKAAGYPIHGMHDDEFSQASPNGVIDPQNPWRLEPDPLPATTYDPISAGTVVRTSLVGGSQYPGHDAVVPAHAKVSLLLERDELTTAYPELTMSGGAGARVRMKYAEALLDEHGEKGNRNDLDGKHISGMYDEFVTDGGQHRSFSPLWWRVWRFVEVNVETADQPLTLESLKANFTAYPFQLNARFESGDSTLGKLWEIGWRTARLSAHDTYMDCPYWEQLQYIADTRPQLLLSYALSGDDRLARQALSAFDHSRIPEGITQSRYPTNQIQVESPFTPLWVSSVHDFWMYRGDNSYVRSLLPGTRAALAWYLNRQLPSGMLGFIPYWTFVDWPTGKMKWENGSAPQEPDGQGALLTMMFSKSLQDAAEMEEALGDASLAERYRAASERANQAVWKLCWDRQRGLIAETPAHRSYSEHANIFAVLAGAVPKDQQAPLLHRLVDAELAGADPYDSPELATATFYFRFYLAHALDQAGLGDTYLSLLGPWKKMIGLGLSTWAETPDPTRSEDHGWSAHPNYDLLTLVAGIRPSAPGFAKVVIAPHLGSGKDALKTLSAEMPHPAGTIRVNYVRTPAGLNAHIILPAGVDGVFRWGGKEVALHPGEQRLAVDAEQ